jgi:hypothetical protein
MLEGFPRKKIILEGKEIVAIQIICNGDDKCGRKMVGEQRARVLCRRTHACRAKGGMVWDNARSLFFSLSRKADRNVHRASLVPANGTVCWDLNSHVCVRYDDGRICGKNPVTRAAAHVEGKVAVSCSALYKFKSEILASMSKNQVNSQA